jgi:hypothetical protein
VNVGHPITLLWQMMVLQTGILRIARDSKGLSRREQLEVGARITEGK